MNKGAKEWLEAQMEEKVSGRKRTMLVGVGMA